MIKSGVFKGISATASKRRKICRPRHQPWVTVVINAISRGAAEHWIR